MKIKRFQEWEQRKLGEITSKIGSGKTPKGGEQSYVTKGIFLLRSQNVRENYIDLSDVAFISNQTDEEMKNSRVQYGDILLNITGASIGRSAVYHCSKLANVNQHVCIIRTIDQYDSKIVQLHISSTKGQNQIASYQAGGGREGINFQQIAKMSFSFPSHDEQERISTLFDSLQSAIVLHQQKYDQLIQLKKAYLDLMFPKTGESTPQVRFANFHDNWEQRKLGELGKTQSGIGFPDSEQGGTEGIPFYKVSDMNNIGNEHEMNNANNYISAEQLLRKKWEPIETVPAVMFAKVGAAIMLNRKRLVTEPFLIDNNTMAYIFDNSWDVDFGKTIFETINLPRYAQVGALPSYNGSDIESIDVRVPSNDEQVKIGVLFKQLDNTITLHQKKIASLKSLKQAYLQKMFV